MFFFALLATRDVEQAQSHDLWRALSSAKEPDFTMPHKACTLKKVTCAHREARRSRCHEIFHHRDSR